MLAAASCAPSAQSHVQPPSGQPLACQQGQLQHTAAASAWAMHGLAQHPCAVMDQLCANSSRCPASRDLVLVGDPDKMRQGDPKSVDTGTFLIRNSERSKALLDRLADIADQFQVGLSRPSSGQAPQKVWIVGPGRDEHATLPGHGVTAQAASTLCMHASHACMRAWS